MKTKKIGVFLVLTIVLTLGLFPMNVFAATKDVTADSKASITVENAVENDVLEAYKIIDITYDATSNHLTYAWNSAFANYFSSTSLEDFDKLEDNSDALKTLLAQLPNYISDNGITAVDTQTVGTDGKATFDNLEMGEYFIRPTTTTSVYQLMLHKIEPTVVDGKYVIDDDDLTFNAKHEEVTISKTADKTSVTKNEKVTYTITVDIPTYSAEATDKSFYIADLLSDGLALDTNSIKIQIKSTSTETGTDTYTNVDESAYTLNTSPSETDNYTFKLDVSTAQYTANWFANAGKQLVITYTATFNDNNSTEVNVKEKNTATFDYSNYPYVENSHEQKFDEYEVNTFAIQIDKYAFKADVTGDEATSDKLAGAVFDLYRTATQEEIEADKDLEEENKKVVTIPHTDIQGIRLEGDITTDENGVATFLKYEANGTNYDYYLVETQAPTGYNILDNAVEFSFTDDEVAKTDGIYTVQISNSSGIKLPITGGEGVVLFTVLGIAFMSGAVFLFIISRKKSNTNYKR